MKKESNPIAVAIALVVIVVTLAIGINARADEPVVTGPISDLIEKRIEQRLQGRLEDLAAKANLPIVSQLAEAKREREGILTQIKELRTERDGIASRIETIKANFAEWQVENQKQKAEWRDRLKEWTPIQNSINRLTKIVLCLIGLVLALFVLCSILVYLYARAKKALASIVS